MTRKVFYVSRFRGPDNGMGFLPLLAAALPSVAGAAGSIIGQRGADKAEKDAMKAQIEIARQQRLAAMAQSKGRAKMTPWIVGGAVVAVGLLAWAFASRGGGKEAR